MYKNDISSYKSLCALQKCIIEYYNVITIIVHNIAELHFVRLSYVPQLIFDGKLDSIDFEIRMEMSFPRYDNYKYMVKRY